MIDVRPGIPEDIDELALTLAEAFESDPVWDWLIPASDHRQRLQTIFKALLRYALPRGNVYTTPDRRAVAMWSPPGEWKLPLSAMVRSAFPMARSAGTRLPRLLGRLGEIEKLHEQVPPEHWYLEFVGTRHDARGTGLGSLLLNDFAQCHQDAVYLESSNPRNLAFYERHGFTVTGEPPMKQGPPQWTLWRDPLS